MLYKKILLILSFVYFTSEITSQTANVYNYDFIDTLIKNQKYKLAGDKLDEILKEDPKNPEALMFKGVILFYNESVSLKKNGQWKAIESIYEPEFVESDLANTTITKETAKKISDYFLHALEGNPEHMNVQLALCYAYAKAGMYKELISRFPYLKKYSLENDNMQQNMIEYGLIVARYHSFDSGLEVLKKIQELYPDDSNVLSEIALLYFQNGHINKSLDVLYKLEDNTGLTKEAIEKLLLVYSTTGEYSRVLKIAGKTANEMEDGMVYKALEERLENNLAWSETLRSYLGQKNDPNNDVENFAVILRKSARKKTLEKHIESTQYNLPAPMLAMNHEWGSMEYPREFDTLFNYADFLAYYGYYNKALSLFKKIIEQKILMREDQKEDLYFHYAWALHKSGQTLKAHQYWKPLIESQDFYKKSAASYFMGKYFYDKKDYDIAKKYFSFVKDNPGKSKYADFCLSMYNEIER